MIKGVGVDIVNIDRINLNLKDKILSNEENNMFLNMSPLRKKEFLAGRFAIKESLYKAGLKIRFNDMNIKYNNDNSIYLENYPNIKVSISHEKEYAIGYAVIED